MTSPNFAELGLAEPLLRALSDAQYATPTPIQARSIPILLEGRDLLGLAETGTGKTAAFVLPILHHLAAKPMHPARCSPRALILAPTRELAIQIGESIATYGRHARVSHTVIFGGVGQSPQVRALQRGVDILVATPGRLLDLMDQRHVRLDGISHFVLDEADRMLDMGFVRDVRKVLKFLPARRQSLLFSATMPDDVARLAADFLNEPVRVEVARVGKTADRIDQRVIFAGGEAKRTVLGNLLQDDSLKRVIVFTRTKRGADRVCRYLENVGVGAHAIHGNKSQGQRQAALDSFRKGFSRVLVATDIAARGIDIDDISHVINFELPNIPESYVHRIGRTARAGAVGVAISLCAPDEREYLRDIEKLTRHRLTVVESGLSGHRHDVDQAAGTEGGSPRRSRDHAPRRHADDRREAHRGLNGRGHGRPDRPRDEANGERRGAQHRDRDDRRAERPAGERRRGDRSERRPMDDAAGPRQDREVREHRPREGRERPAHHDRRDHKTPAAGARSGHGGENRRERDAGATSTADRDAPQPWRNWTGGGEGGNGRLKRPGTGPNAGKPRHGGGGHGRGGQGGGGRGGFRSGKGRPAARSASQA